MGPDTPECELVWSFWGRKKCLAPTGFRTPGRLDRSLVAIPTTLLRFLERFQTQFTPAHCLGIYFLKILFNIMLPSMRRSSKWSVPSCLLDENVHTHLIYLCVIHLPPILFPFISSHYQVYRVEHKL
jgi:hypothetical protein